MSRCVGELLIRSEELNSQVCDSLSSRAACLTSPADKSNPFGLYDYLLVYHPEEHTATMELLAAVEKGEIPIQVRFFTFSCFFCFIPKIVCMHGGW